MQGLQVVAKAERDPRRLMRGVDGVLLTLAAECEQTTCIETTYTDPWARLRGGPGGKAMHVGAEVHCARPGARMAR